MKKYVVLAAAIAMVAFAGCKKEESGLVTLNIATENTVSNDKQSYEADYSRVIFNDGDDIYVNGIVGSVTALNGETDPYTTDGPMGFSYKGQITVDPAAVGSDFLVVYPGPNNGINYVSDEYRCTFVSDFAMVPEVAQGYPTYAGTQLTSDYQPWPMAAYYTCGQCVLEDGRFVLKNAVATLTPSILYGVAWYNAMAARNGWDAIYNPAELPAIVVDAVEIVSSDAPLCGEAKLVDLNTSNPRAEIFADRGYQLSAIAVDGTEHYYNLNPQFIGEIPVAPIMTTTTLVMNMHFHMIINGTEHYFVYQGGRSTIPAGTIARGVRTVLQVNMRDNHLETVPTDEYMARFVSE